MSAFHSAQNSENFSWNRAFWSYATGIFETTVVVHFDRSGHFGRSDRNVPLHLTTLLSPVPLFSALHTKRGGWDRVCATGMYRSIGHMEFPKFPTGLFVD